MTCLFQGCWQQRKGTMCMVSYLTSPTDESISLLVQADTYRVVGSSAHPAAGKVTFYKKLPGIHQLKENREGLRI